MERRPSPVAGGLRRCVVCNVDERDHEPCSCCFVLGPGGEPSFLRRARGVAICRYCDAYHRASGIMWSDDELITGDADDVASDEARAPVSYRDAIRPERPPGRPRDAAIDELVLPAFAARARTELVVRTARPRRTWSADERGRYRCGACQRRGHNRRSCDGGDFSRRRRRRRGTYARQTYMSNRQIADAAGCAHTSVDRRFNDFLAQISLAR